MNTYLLNAPVEAWEKLKELRAILKEITPNAHDAIKWGKPVMEEIHTLKSFLACKLH